MKIPFDFGRPMDRMDITVAAAALRQSGLNVQEVESREPPSIDSLKWMEHDRIPQSEVIASNTFVIHGVPFVALAHRAEEKLSRPTIYWQLLTIDNGFVAYPADPSECMALEASEDVDIPNEFWGKALTESLCNSPVLLEVASVGFERLHWWFAKCCGMQGVPIPDYIDKVAIQ